MLVLTRKKDEAIIVNVHGVEIKILVVHLGHNNVRLGIQAPTDVVIDRAEVADAKKRCEPVNTNPRPPAAAALPAQTVGPG